MQKGVVRIFLLPMHGVVVSYVRGFLSHSFSLSYMFAITKALNFVSPPQALWLEVRLRTPMRASYLYEP